MIMTDDIPVRLDYVEHLDQVWVLCRGQMESSYGIPSKTSVIIRQASAEIRHHPVHTQPVSNKFDLVNVHLCVQVRTVWLITLIF